MASSQIKDAIVHLCRMLKHGSICKEITPEHFRQAKRNNSDASSVMLQLLLGVLRTIRPSHDEVNFNDLSALMKDFGYPRCPALISSVGSKELLLCFAWLLHCTRFLDSIRDQSLQSTKPLDVLLHDKKVKTQKGKEDSTVGSLRKNILRDENFKSVHTREQSYDNYRHSEFSRLPSADKVNYIQWLVGKIEIESNRLQGLTVNASNMTAQAVQRSASTGEYKKVVDIPVIDALLLLRHPSIIHQCESDTERKIQYLQAYTKWKELESVFWKWLENLVDEDEDTLYEESDSRLSSKQNMSDVNRNLLTLSKKLSELKLHLYEKQKTWLERVKVNPSNLTRVRVEQENEIEKEVSLLYQLIGVVHNEPLLVSYDAGTSQTPITFPLSLETEILKKKLTQIKEELSTTRHLFNEELAMISNTKLGEKAILVSPPGSL